MIINHDLTLSHNGDLVSGHERGKNPLNPMNFVCLGQRVRLPWLPCASYPRFNDGGPRVQNALHLPQGRDDKKITGDNSGHGVS